MLILIINILLWILVVVAILFLLYRHRLLLRQLDSMRDRSSQQAEHPAFSMELPNTEVEQPSSGMLSDSERSFLQRLTGFVHEEMEQGRVGIDSLASKMCLSRSQLNRKVHAATGMSTIEFTQNLRIQQACQLLLDNPDTTISQVAQQSGFDDPGYFARIFRRQMGMAPSEYRRIKLAASSINT